MNLPIGKLFYFIPKIQERNNGDHYAPYGGANGVTSNTDVDAGYGANARNLYDRFYEAGDGNSPDTGLFDYSKGSYDDVTLNAAAVVAFSLPWHLVSIPFRNDN